MKKIFLISFLLFISEFSFAQYPEDIKSDYTWIFGYGTNPPLHYGNIILKFNGFTFDTTYIDGNTQSYLCNSSISDTSGNYLFFSQGFCAYDSGFKKIEGTDSMNCCNNVFNGSYNNGYPVIDGVLILKKPLSENLFYIFHKPAENFPNYPLSLSLRQTIVALEDTFRGIYKDSVIYSDSLVGNGNLEVCRHANGRDWWLIQKHQKKNRYFIFLFDSQGLQLEHTIDLDGYVPPYFTQAVFSPDGKNYIIAGIHNLLNDSIFVAKFDFDRCTGLLSNPEYFYWSTSSVGSGCAVSPNSRYLYVSSTYEIYQFDLESVNWQSTKTTVAVYDGFADIVNGDPWNTIFQLMQIAPDNKIYITGGATRYLSTIDNPDEGGIGCNVNQHSFKLSSINGRTIPNFPNYRLGPIDGSSCDTLGIDVISNIDDMLDNNINDVNIYPNPASDYITLMIPRITKEWEFVIYDINGKEVLHSKSRGAFRSYNLSALSGGMYLWKLKYSDGKTENGKLVKQ